MAKTFPFFRLPRELRDRVYADIPGRDIEFKLSHVTRNTLDPSNGETAIEKKCYTTTTLLGAPMRDIMVICKKFRVEYEAEIDRFATLRIRGLEDSATDDDEFDCYAIESSSKVLRRICGVPCLQVVTSIPVENMQIIGSERLPLPPSKPPHYLLLVSSTNTFSQPYQVGNSLC